MKEKKKWTTLDTIGMFLGLIGLLAGVFAGNGMVLERDLYAKIGLWVFLGPLVLIIILFIIYGIYVFIINKINWKRYEKAKKQKNIKKKGQIKYDKIEPIEISNDMMEKYSPTFGVPACAWIFGFFVMIVFFREGVGELSRFLLGLFVLAITGLIIWGVFKFFKKVLGISYGRGIAILLVTPIIISIISLIRENHIRKNNAIYIDIKYGDSIDIQDYEVLSTFPSSFIEIAYYSTQKNHLILKMDDTYYEFCGVSSSLWKDFKSANSYGKFFNQHIKGKHDCD